MPIKTLMAKEIVDGCIVELHDYSKWHRNPEQYLAQIASLTRGKDTSADPKALWQRLLTESEGKPSSCFEFLWTNADETMMNMRDVLQYELAKKGNGRKEINWIKGNIRTFKLTVPIYIARQIMRHRFASYCELSRRYTSKDVCFHVPERIKEDWGEALTDYYKRVIQYYDYFLHSSLPSRKSMPAELARLILPVATMTQLWVQYRVGYGWENFLKVRTSKRAQEETRKIALTMQKLVEGRSE